MPSDGPRYEVQPAGAAWLRHLDEKDVESFYHNPRLYAWLKAHPRLAFLKPLLDAAAPRGYSTQDNLGGASPGDLVVTNQAIHDLARAAYVKLQDGKVPPRKEVDALLLVLHEHTHCMVRLLPDGKPWQSDLEAYSHPNQLAAALQHARRRGYPINAFTGLLRRNRTPSDAWTQGLAWFGARLAERELA